MIPRAVIPRQTRGGIAVLVLLAMLSFWAARQFEPDGARPLTDIDTRLEYALREFEARYFDAQGRPAVILRSPRFASDAATGEGRVVQPELEIQHQGFLWHIIADAAVVPDDQSLIHLTGRVRMQRTGSELSDWMEIQSRDVTVEVGPRVAHSGQPVEITDLAGRMTAEGFNIDMTENTYRLENDVRGAYVLP